MDSNCQFNSFVDISLVHLCTRILYVTVCVVFMCIARKAKEVTEEMLLKRSERNKRRKILADKRKEKNKVGTVLLIQGYIQTTVL